VSSKTLGAFVLGKGFLVISFTSVCNLAKVCSASCARMDKAYINP